MEQTLVLIKPDGVERGIVGKIITRLEDAGLKIIGMKMVWVDKEFAKKHYTEDIAKRRGKHVRNYTIDYLLSGPVVAMILEGINAIDNVRKICGTTEPKSAPPGTIRGDFSHASFDHCDKKKKVVRNLIHASANQKDAKSEINLWFKRSELLSYSTVHEKHTF